MRLFSARMLFGLALLVYLGWLPGTLLGGTPKPSEEILYLAQHLSEEELLQITSSAGATGRPIFIDSIASNKYTLAFVEANLPQAPIFVNSRILPHVLLPNSVKRAIPIDFERNPLPSITLEPTNIPAAVVAPANPRRLLLHAACLAGALQAPLFIATDKEIEAQRPADERNSALLGGRFSKAVVYAVGGTSKMLGNRDVFRTIALNDEESVAAACLQYQQKSGPITTLVLANPSDVNGDGCKMSTLAPWIALQKRAALVLTNDAGTNAEDAIKGALQNPDLAQADVLLIAADLQAIPMCKRPNPIEGDRDVAIEMEPMTPVGNQPCSFSVGRIFHPDRNVIALTLARQRLLANEKNPKALIVSNPGGGLPLLETFSQYTVNEFKNAGYDTTAHIGRGSYKADVRMRLPDANIFLWEGHYGTLANSYAVQDWPEPLKPSLIFLQSCLALTEAGAHPFLERGAIGVIGSSTRTYSGSGGALALAFFDSLLYEDQSLGSSLRQAKNFMLAFAELKKRRFGEESKLAGANLRAAWAFTLWGDPTVKLPRPPVPADALTPVRHVVKGDTIIVTLPDEQHDEISNSKYQALVPANARLAGLVRKQDMEDRNRMVPFVFAEVQLPKAKPGVTPQVRTRLPRSHWVFCYDERCQRGYLLVTPRASDRDELRFQLVWD